MHDVQICLNKFTSFMQTFVFMRDIRKFLMIYLLLDLEVNFYIKLSRRKLFQAMIFRTVCMNRKRNYYDVLSFVQVIASTHNTIAFKTY